MNNKKSIEFMDYLRLFDVSSNLAAMKYGIGKEKQDQASAAESEHKSADSCSPMNSMNKNK